MAVSLFIGLRYTGARARNQLVAFLARVSMLGLIVGVGLLIAVLSIMNGFDKELREKILGLVPQAAVYHHDGIEDWQGLQTFLEGRPHVLAAAPFVQLNGLVAKHQKAEPVVLYGIDPKQEARVSRMQEFIPRSILSALGEKADAMVLGSAVADKLGLNAGDTALVLIPSSRMGGTPEVQYVTILARIHSNTELDNTLALMNLEAAAELSSQPHLVTGLRLRLDDLFRARDVVWQALVTLGGEYYGSSWENTHGNLYHAIHLSKKLIALLMFMIVAIAAFNVVSTLVMVVVEKEADIAILRTMGASSGTIMTIFMVLGTAIGVVGTALGVGAGVGLSAVMESMVRSVEGLLGVQFLSSEVYPLTYLPAQVLMTDISRVAMAALGMSFLATLYPAWRASRVLPAQALRYE